MIFRFSVIKLLDNRNHIVLIKKLKSVKCKMVTNDWVNGSPGELGDKVGALGPEWPCPTCSPLIIQVNREATNLNM